MVPQYVIYFFHFSSHVAILTGQFFKVSFCISSYVLEIKFTYPLNINALFRIFVALNFHGNLMHHFCSMPPMSVTKMMPEATHQKQAALGPQPDAQIPQPVMKMNDVRNSPASVPSKPATYQNSAKDLNAIKVRVGICFLANNNT